MKTYIDRMRELREDHDLTQYDIEGQCMKCQTIGELREYHGLDLSRCPDGKEKLLEFPQHRFPFVQYHTPYLV